jgi:hypothetical protein
MEAYWKHLIIKARIWAVRNQEVPRWCLASYARQLHATAVVLFKVMFLSTRHYAKIISHVHVYASIIGNWMSQLSCLVMQYLEKTKYKRSVPGPVAVWYSALGLQRTMAPLEQGVLRTIVL